MSHIHYLIQQHCPDGVPLVEIQDLFEIRNGYTPSKSNSDFWEDGTVPWFRMDDIRENGRLLTDSLQHVTVEAVKAGKFFPAGSIIVATSATIGEHALIQVPHLTNQRFSCLSVKSEMADRVDMKFLFYYGFVLDEWCKSHTTKSSFSTVDMPAFRKFRFPIPPLPVQEEIVRILDSFTKLEAELEAELEARRQQYEHYVTILMYFDERFPQVHLGEVAEIRSGWGFPKKYQGEPAGEYPFYKVSDMNRLGNETQMASSKNWITTSMAANLGVKVAPAGTVIFPKIGAAIGTNKKRLLTQPSAYDNNVMGIIPGSSLSSRFLYYWMQTFNLSLLANDSGAVPSIRKSEAEKVSIPLPPLEEQRRIVATLDSFSAMVNDLSSGLPAEITARRQQYEYYRDRLLSFEELSA